MTLRSTIFTIASVVASGVSLFAQDYLPEVTQEFEEIEAYINSEPTEIDLRDYLAVDGIDSNHSLARFDTVLGIFDIELFDTVAPLTVFSFLEFVADEDWDNSIFHRFEQTLQIDGVDESLERLFGGSYKAELPVGEIDSGDFLQVNEFGESNIRGTLTKDIVRTPESQWFFNLIDNSELLDAEFDDDGQVLVGGYTAFGRVIGSGMEVLDALSALPVSEKFLFPFHLLPVIDYDRSDDITLDNFATINSIRELELYPKGNDNDSLILITAVSTDPNIVAASLDGYSLVLESKTQDPNDSAFITLTASVYGEEVSRTFEVNLAYPPAEIFSQPIGRAVQIGGNIELSVATSFNPDKSYQWMLDGVDIPGATEMTLSIGNAAETDSGNYQIIVSYPDIELTSDLANVQIVDEFSRLANLSTRAYIGAETDSTPIIAGFVLDGEGSKSLLFRGIAPGLLNVNEGLVDALIEDPTLDLRDGTVTIATNDNWTDENDVELIEQTTERLGAFALGVGSADSVLLSDPLSEKTYNAKVDIANGTEGIALVEIYDADENPDEDEIRLINLSTRAEVRSDLERMVAGFVVKGDSPINVLIRAVGPGLQNEGITEGLLEDPMLELLNSNGALIASNDDWESHSSYDSIPAIASEVGAFELESGSKDATLFLTLEPGAYTARISGADDTTGTALAEIYEVK